MSAMIQFKNVSYTYGVNSKPAVQDVTLTIPRGEFVSLVGPNGGGKSTLINLLLGLLKPQTGSVLLFGESPEKSRYRVGYAPQQARVDFNFPISVLDVTLAGRFGVPSASGGEKGPKKRLWFQRFARQDKERALAALEKMQVADLSRKSFGDLSGGQRQRVLIARALCSDPDLLVLDEPTNNVDPANAEALRQRLLQTPGITENPNGTFTIDASKITDKTLTLAITRVTDFTVSMEPVRTPWSTTRDISRGMTLVTATSPSRSSRAAAIYFFRRKA